MRNCENVHDSVENYKPAIELLQTCLRLKTKDDIEKSVHKVISILRDVFLNLGLK